MAVTAVVFDIGGVLETTPDLGTVPRWCGRLGLSEAEFERRTRAIWAAGVIGEATLGQVHERLAVALGVESSIVDAMMEEVWVEYLGTVNEDLVGFARSLRPRWRTGILSNSFVGATEREQAAYGFADLVDEVCYSHEIGVAKPEPRAYEIVCARLGAAPHEAIFLDDVPRCVEGARSYGMRAVRFVDNAQAIAEIEGLLREP